MDSRPVLVIGGGIAGMTAAVEAAEVGYHVILVEKEPYLGGRVMRTYRYFPKMCPPTCGFEINARRIKTNARITVHTQSTVEEISGIPPKIKAKIRVRPRYVTGKVPVDKTVLERVTSERDDDFNLGMKKTKALYLPHSQAYPHDYVLDREALSAEDEAMLKEHAEDAVDLDMAEETLEVTVGAVIIATGWKPYEATKLDNLGYGKFPNVITNVMMERLAAREGPTEGQILRPSDHKPPTNVAFVQCAGSRDENHLPYCSSVCCMASLKHVRYLREKCPDAKATVFYIDLRTIGRLEKFYYEMLDDELLSFTKGKVAEITEAANGNNLVLKVEDTIARENLETEFDMVVLATGMVPNAPVEKDLDILSHDDYGFVIDSDNGNGIFAVGCAKHACDVSRSTKDATAAALKAIQCLGSGV